MDPQIKKEFENVHQSLGRLEQAICGDPEVGHTGLVKRMDRIERRFSPVEKAFWGLLGVGATLGVIAEVFQIVK